MKRPDSIAQKGKLLIVGNGMATDRLLECLAAENHGFEIQVLSDEIEPAYNRIRLSAVLASEIGGDELRLKAASWYRQQGIEILYGETATQINPDHKHLVTQSGRRLNYDKLVLATGSRANLPPIAGVDHPAVRCFRNMRDVEFLISQSKSIRRVVVVGGGLLGLEAAHGMNLAGVETHLVHRQPYLMNRQLDRRGAEILQARLEDRGIRFYLGANPIEINDMPAEAEGKAELVLDTDQPISADLIIFAAGITPNKELAENAGVACGKAVQVDDFMQTNIADIYAIGECAEHQGRTIGLVAPAKGQAEVLAANLLGTTTPYRYSETSTRLKVSGIELFCAGEIATGKAGATQNISLVDAEFGIYRNLAIENNQLRGAVLLGDKRSGSWYEQLIEEGVDVSRWLPKLVFGREFCNPTPTELTEMAQ